MNEHYIHEFYVTEDGRIFLLDIADTFDCRWESAYNEVDIERFNRWWNYTNEDEELPTIEDIINYAEDSDAFYGWVIVESNCNKRSCRRLYNELKKLVEGI